MKILRKSAKYIVFIFLPTIILFLALEGTQRIRLYYSHGRNPMWLYWGKTRYKNYPGYYKFDSSSNITLGQIEGLQIRTKTNSRGFRGPDFIPEKPPRTTRVIALGGSSTTGVLNPDSHTYPRLLESRLNSGTRSPTSFEVINAGFPSFTLSEIVSMLKREVMAYSPDWIIIYSGANDSNRITTSLMVRVKNRLMHKSVLFLTLREKIASLMGNNLDIVHQPTFKVSSREYESIEEKVLGRYEAKLRSIIRLAATKGTKVMLVTQPINTDIQYKHRKRLGVSDYVPSERLYGERQRVFRKRLASQGWVWNFEAAFMIHGSLMEIQRRISRQMSLALWDLFPSRTPILKSCQTQFIYQMRETRFWPRPFTWNFCPCFPWRGSRFV